VEFLYIWSGSGEIVSEYDNWDEGLPNTPFNFEMSRMYLYAKTYKWRHALVSLTDVFGVICEELEVK
jgi:hypothetical protein